MKKKGFTLIELLIVIVIIGILAVAFLPTALNAPKRARDAQRKAHLQAIVQAVEQYGLDSSAVYPTSTSNCASTDLDTPLKDYFREKKTPVDPKVETKSYPNNKTCSNGEYYYFYTSGSGGCYILAAVMEDSKSGNTDTLVGTGALSCGAPTLDATKGGSWFVIRNKI